MKTMWGCPSKLTPVWLGLGVICLTIGGPGMGFYTCMTIASIFLAAGMVIDEIRKAANND